MLNFLSSHCMAMLTYPCMEESCVCTVPASRSIVPLRYVQCWSQLSSYQKKNKKKSKHPQLTVAFYLHYLKWINGYLQGERILRLSERYEGEMECRKRWGREKKTPQCQIVQEREREECAIFICPCRETTVATIPAIGLIQEDKLNWFPFLGS